MPTDPRPTRALRLACGVACATALGFGLALPLPYISPMLTLFLLAMSNQPLGLKGGLKLALVIALITSAGLLLCPLLRYQPFSGVLLVALGLFFSFRFSLRGNALLGTLMVVGLTLITAAGSVQMALGQMVIEGLLKGVLFSVLAMTLSHALFPEPSELPPAPPAAAPPSDLQVDWLALRAMLVVMPAWLLALINPASYLPLVMKSASVGQQTCALGARHEAREMLGSTLLGGALAILFWLVLSLCPSLWLFFLLTLLFFLLLARHLYQLLANHYSPSFWLNTGTTLIILLGQSVQDSAAGKDVYQAFAVRLLLFCAVALYASLMVHLLDSRRARRLLTR